MAQAMPAECWEKSRSEARAQTKGGLGDPLLAGAGGPAARSRIVRPRDRRQAAWFALVEIRAHFVSPRCKRGARMIDFKNGSFFKLKASNEYADKVTDLLIEGEKVIGAFKA